MAKSVKTDAKLYRKTKIVKGVSYEYWVARQTHEGTPIECSATTQIEALQKLAQKISDLESGIIGITSKMTVARWAGEWLETYKRPAIGYAQYRRYLTHINNVIIPEIGNMKITEIKDIHLQKILNSRAGKSRSDVTKMNILLKAMFRQAQLSRLISFNPAETLQLPAAKAGQRRSITQQERECILELAESHHAGLWIKIMLYCGLRPGETRALDWRHIDLSNTLIHVEQSMKASTTDIGSPKSAAGVRNIPIPDNLITALQSVRGGPYEPVLTQITTGKRHTANSMDGMWTNFKRELDILMGAKVYRNQIAISVVAPDLTAYCLRHTYATDLQGAGVPINIAKYLLGHSSIAVTANIYTHTTDAQIADAAAKINAAQEISMGKTVGNTL